MRRILFAPLVLGGLLCMFLVLWDAPSPTGTEDRSPEHTDPLVSTFSIVGYCPATRSWGVATQSRFLAVGSVVPWARAGVGAVATQAWANPAYGPDGLEHLAKGASATDVVAALTKADARRTRRQLGMIDAKGRPAAYTGEDCLAHAGHAIGRHCACQGNILAGPEVVVAMREAFEEDPAKPLADRLMEALRAAQGAGGDKRGQQSAALLVVREGGGYGGTDRFVDLRVDDHATPIEELARLLALHKKLWQRAHAEATPRARPGAEAPENDD